MGARRGERVERREGREKRREERGGMREERGERAFTRHDPDVGGEERFRFRCDARRTDLMLGSIQFEYDPDELATKTTAQLVHKSNSKTYV